MTQHKITNTKLNADDIRVTINDFDHKDWTDEEVKEVDGLLSMSETLITSIVITRTSEDLSERFNIYLNDNKISREGGGKYSDFHVNIITGRERNGKEDYDLFWSPYNAFIGVFKNKTTNKELIIYGVIEVRYKPLTFEQSAPI